ncbi:hypothetical protein EDD37DRAFT_471716 [Exophiala viscosa]|uniref:uncharacterized protein n=1 Tax=Exophiala viscosa TaxID=2486360 RepID=UPI00219A9353|nr:hypothetical protein EDD37DRAFT_471716 [Exophiala viscosa]
MLEQKDAGKTLLVRPVTSMGDAPQAQTTQGEQTGSSEADQLHRRRRSAGHVADPIEAIATARARLRSIAGQRTANGNQPRDRAPTLAELNDMLDDAIENTSTQPHVLSDEDTDVFNPTSALISRPHTSQSVHRQSQSHGRESRRSIDSHRPRSSEESVRVDYGQSPAEGTGRTPLQSKGLDSSPEPRRARKSLDIKSAQALSSPARPEPKTRETSPVKQTAAIFESLNKKPREYDEAHEHRHQGHGTSWDGVDKQNGTKKMHKIKLGETIEERPGTPLIPFALPAMVKDQQEFVKGESAPEQEQSNDAYEEDQGDKVIEHNNQRKPSFSWPFKWGIFSKTPAPSQEAEHPDEAKQDKQPRTKPGVVKSRVHELMQVANEKEDAEKRRRRAENERVSRWRNRGPPFVKEYELREDKVDLEDLKSSQLPPLQVPVDDEAEGVNPAPNPDDVLSEPSSLQRAMTEKQVLSAPSECDAPSVLTSPTRSVPRTPVRGRPTKLGHRLSIGEPFGVEQQFKLSPGPSRSASRNGRAGVKVEVEVRDSPEREGRERGEKIVIIRADVEAAEVQV